MFYIDVTIISVIILIILVFAHLHVTPLSAPAATSISTSRLDFHHHHQYHPQHHCQHHHHARHHNMISRLGTPRPPLTWSNSDPMDIFTLATSTPQGNEQDDENDVHDDEGKLTL